MCVWGCSPFYVLVYIVSINNMLSFNLIISRPVHIYIHLPPCPHLIHSLVSLALIFGVSCCCCSFSIALLLYSSLTHYLLKHTHRLLLPSTHSPPLPLPNGRCCHRFAAGTPRWCRPPPSPATLACRSR